MKAENAAAKLLNLSGRLALVTGGRGGIGSEITRLLTSVGADVIVVDLPDDAPTTEGEFWPTDLSDRREVARLGARLREERGRLDLLIHACGLTRDNYLTRTTDEDWDDVLHTNLDSAFYLMRETGQLLRESSTDGSVVLISSINGERGKIGQANYCASKAGLIGLGRSAAREFGAWGVRVNIVSPGLIDSPMTARLPPEVRARAMGEIALGRAGRPEDVARAVLFLCSPLSGHITGQVLRVDGGQLIA